MQMSWSQNLFLQRMSQKAKSIVYIGNMLSKHGYTPTTIETLSKRLSKNFTVYAASDKKSMFKRLLDMWLTVILHNKSNLAILDTYSSKAFHFARTSAFLCRIFGIPYVAYIHGGMFYKRVESSRAQVKKYIRNASTVVAPSQFLLESVKDFSKGEMVVIPNTVELEHYPYTNRSNLRTFHIFWLRSLQKIYRPLLAVDVLLEIRKIYPHAKLTIVGPDKDGSKARLEAKVKENNLSNDVRITGRLNREQWLEVSKECDLFLNTTSADNTPVSVIEGMAIGLPIVSANVGGMPFLIEHESDGLLVDSSDPKEFAKALISIYESDELYQKLSSNARSKVESFDWKEVEKQWLNLINEY